MRQPTLLNIFYVDHGRWGQNPRVSAASRGEKKISWVHDRGRSSTTYLIRRGHALNQWNDAVDLPMIDHRLERIEDEMRGISEALKHLTRVDERLKQHRDSIDDHESRIRDLEQMGHRAKGSFVTAERVVWFAITSGLALMQFVG